VRSGVRAVGRPGWLGLVVGLVVLITAHLAGTVHSSLYEGPHVSPVAAVCVHHGADGDGRFAPDPGHDHEADTHIDHAADRPRTVSADDTVLEPGFDGLVPTPAVGGGGAATPRDPPAAVTGSSDGRSTLVLHCVWRQ